MKKNRVKRWLLLFAAFLIFGVLLLKDPPGGETEGPERGLTITSGTEKTGESRTSEENSAEEGGPTEQLFVYVYGAVSTPGVYSLPVGSRVCDAVEAAGGYLGEADPSSQNPVRVLKDGEMLRVAFSGEESEEEGTRGDGLIDLNRADKALLMSLPGIGEAKAGAIVSYRETKGPFQSIEDVMLVSGIGEGVFSQIKDKIKV